MFQSTDFIPSRSFESAETHDATEHARRLTGWRGVHFEHVGRQPFQGHVADLCLRPIQIMHEYIDQPCVYHGAAWPGSLLFLSNLAADGDMYCAGRRINDSAITMFPWYFSSNAFMRGAARSVLIAVDERALADYARAVLNREMPRDQLRRALSITNAETVEAFQRCALGIIGELTDRPKLLESDSYMASVKNQVLDMLVRIVDSSVAESRLLSPPSTRSYIVEKANHYMSSRLADPLEISEVCDALRVSPRTLRYSFEEMVGVSPAQYLLALRLGRVRRDLLKAGKFGRIHCIAERHGFAHMGRFAKFYGDAFGERPSETCRRGAELPRFQIASESLQTA